MQKHAMVSGSSGLADAASGLVTQGPMAHQFGSLCGGEPAPQKMIHLIGCRVETGRQHGRKKNLTAAANSSGPSTARAQR